MEEDCAELIVLCAALQQVIADERDAYEDRDPRKSLAGSRYFARRKTV